jgi:ubiquinone/menaquinone biosynthesis C-methylase UbiE
MAGTRNTGSPEDPKNKRSQAPMMEGMIARWYARQRGSAPQLELVRDFAARVTSGLPDGAAVLEVAPGPGYLAVELARRGYRVTGLDISRSFVEMAGASARRAGVRARFVLGDAAALPFAAGSFDLIVCQAAFKNFGAADRVLDEMHRVLRDGATAVIEDMNRDATRADIDREVRGMGLNAVNSFMTRLPLRRLRRRAYSVAEFERLAAASAFGTGEISADGIGLTARLTKRDGAES